MNPPRLAGRVFEFMRPPYEPEVAVPALPSACARRRVLEGARSCRVEGGEMSGKIKLRPMRSPSFGAPARRAPQGFVLLGRHKEQKAREYARDPHHVESQSHLGKRLVAAP